MNNKHPVQLIVQYYRSVDPARQVELDTCLRNNLVNQFISKVHLLTEEKFDFVQFPNVDKIVQRVVGERLTFEMAFSYANDFDSEGDLIWILSNADIYFDESLKLVEWEYLDGVVYALTRHDVQADGAIKLVDSAFAHGCQDAWFFRSPLPLNSMFTQFYLGIPGCDNRIANEFIQAGSKVINPAYLLRSLHLDLTRNADIWERDKEYASLMTDESIVTGQVAPPPYQYHIYPVDQLEPDSMGMYQANIRHLTELGLQITDRERTQLQQSRQIEELGDLLDEKYRQLAEMTRQSEEHGCLIKELYDEIEKLYQRIDCQKLQYERSLSWKITKPIRAIHALLTGK